MAGLQRSVVSFRRQGSSGLVWDDRFISGELNRVNNNNQTTGDAGGVLNKPELDPHGITTKESSPDLPKLPSPRTRRNHPPPLPVEITVPLERNRSTGGGGRYRTGRASPAAIEPPSPKVSACGLCAPFGKQPGGRARKKARHGNNRRSR